MDTTDNISKLNITKAKDTRSSFVNCNIWNIETLSSGFIIGFETSEFKKCCYRNYWLWLRTCFETS